MAKKLFSLDKFRVIKNDNYDTQEECKQNIKKWYQTNPKYKKFDQIHYHAGDYEDLEKYGFMLLRYYYSKKIKKKVSKIPIYTLYENIDYTSVMNTFKYMFDKHKKGLFVMIRNNEIVLFLPFSNAHYQNNFYDKIYFSQEEKELLEKEGYDKAKKQLDRNIKEFEKKHEKLYITRKLDTDRKNWKANGCIFKNLFPSYEGETNTDIFKTMLSELLKHRKIPDVEFFINQRDFPILKKDFTEAYHHIYDSYNMKMSDEFIFDKMAPIFSPSNTKDFADLLIPNQDDWLRVTDKYFTDDCGTPQKLEFDKYNYDWDKKKPVCIFRGSSTGCGITVETNVRLRASDISVDNKDILDAGITNWNERPKKYFGKPIDIIDTNSFRFGLANKISNIEKSFYKYFLNLDGHSTAFRLSHELMMNSVVIWARSSNEIWFTHLLKEYEHYIPVNESLDNLISQIRWCIDNDDKCKKIAENARKFYDKYLTEEGIYNYFQDKLNIIHSNKRFSNLLDLDIKKKKKVAIICCYRNTQDNERRREKKYFVKVMTRILRPYCDATIYIIEQSKDGNRFNIGKLKNIGFKIASSEDDYEHYIFSDIDMIPNYDLINYYAYSYKHPLSLAMFGTRYTKNKAEPFIGGVASFTKEVFEKINGFPNNFWGWGGEDRSVLIRIVANKFKLLHPKKGKIIDIEESKSHISIGIEQKMENLEKESRRYEKMYYDLQDWDKNGLNSLVYKVLKRKELKKCVYQITVDLQKEEDKDIEEITDYKKIKKSVNEFINKVKIEGI